MLTPLLLFLPILSPHDEPELGERLTAAAREAAPEQELEVGAWFAAVGEGPDWELAAHRALLAPVDPPPWLAEAVDHGGRVQVRAVAAALRRTLAGPAAFDTTRLQPVVHPLLGRSTVLRMTRSRHAWLAAGRWEHAGAAFDFVVLVAAADAAGEGTSLGWRALAAAEEELTFAARTACALPAIPTYRFGGPFEPTPPDAEPRAVVPFGAIRVPGAFSRFVIGARPGDVVADIGCGSGADVKLLAEVLGPTSRVLARDVDERRIPRRPVAENLEFALSRVDDVAIEAETLDLAYMQQVLHYVLRQEDTRDAFAASLLAALVPGGRLFVIQHESPGSNRDVEAAAGEALFARAGFEIGPRWRIHDGRDGRRVFLVLEFRRPPRD